MNDIDTEKLTTPLSSARGAGGEADYTDDNIRTLSGTEHIRLRPGMYIGRLGDGSLAEDGIYVLLKEVSTTLSMSSR